MSKKFIWQPCFLQKPDSDVMKLLRLNWCAISWLLPRDAKQIAKRARSLPPDGALAEIQKYINIYIYMVDVYIYTS